MLNQPTLNGMQHLKLFGMLQAFEEQRQQASYQGLGFDERLGLLIDRECSYRQNRRLQGLLRQAQLKQAACLEDVDYRGNRGLDKSQIAQLAGGDWLRQGHNLLLTGSTGVGKTYLACALGHHACRLGMSVRYVRLPRLLEELRISHGDGSYARKLKQLAKLQVLILDDWGLVPLQQAERNDLLEVLDDRSPLRSTVVTSQLPTNTWHDAIGEATLADAILDRLLHNSIKIELKGESLRKKPRKN
jgi:DNA replication protein DnaC